MAKDQFTPTRSIPISISLSCVSRHPRPDPKLAASTSLRPGRHPHPGEQQNASAEGPTWPSPAVEQRIKGTAPRGVRIGDGVLSRGILARP